MALGATACGAGGGLRADGAAADEPSEGSVVVEEFGATPAELERGDDEPVAGAVPGGSTDGAPGGDTSLFPLIGSARDHLPETGGPVPVSLVVEGVNARPAPVRPVGVEANGEMEIPSAEEVGWYRYGPSPGAVGSAVLAAHIAYDGVDGVFRNLGDVEPGARVTVAFDDGTIGVYSVIGLRQYAKDRLPVDEIFARTGTPRLALITCGGDFNRSLSSYTDNIVVFAVPLAVYEARTAE